jgi:hypothetical protein
MSKFIDDRLSLILETNGEPKTTTKTTNISMQTGELAAVVINRFQQSFSVF